MEVKVRLLDEEGDASLRSLGAWLRSDPEVAWNVSVAFTRKPVDPQEQGGALDTLQVVFNDAISLANVLIVYGTWRSTQTRRRRVEFERGDGRRVEDSDGSPESRQQVADFLADPGSDDGTSSEEQGPHRDDR